jgi:hypothetical protein
MKTVFDATFDFENRISADETSYHDTINASVVSIHAHIMKAGYVNSSTYFLNPNGLDVILYCSC